MITEEEASNKWCPFVQVADIPTIGRLATNRVNVVEDFRPGSPSAQNLSRCLGSQCMAWRWLNGDGLFSGQTDVKVRGFCGLAGSPVSP